MAVGTLTFSRLLCEGESTEVREDTNPFFSSLSFFSSTQSPSPKYHHRASSTAERDAQVVVPSSSSSSCVPVSASPYNRPPFSFFPELQWNLLCPFISRKDNTPRQILRKDRQTDFSPFRFYRLANFNTACFPICNNSSKPRLSGSVGL